MRLGEAIDFCEESLDHKLSATEIVLVGRMVDAGKDGPEILALLELEQDADVEETEGETFLYEASGDGVVQIPEVVPEETTDAD